MAIKQKLYKALDQQETFITQRDMSSFLEIDDMPALLTAGKNFFRIAGTSALNGTFPVLMEAIDALGNVIYTEVPNYIDTLKRRIITLFVYQNCTKGPVTITLIAAVNDPSIPIEWQNKYNYKFQTTILADPSKQNGAEIIFNEPPRVFIVGLKMVSKEISPANLIFKTQYMTASLGMIDYHSVPFPDYYLEGSISSKIANNDNGAGRVWSQLATNDVTAVTLGVRGKAYEKTHQSLTFGMEIAQPDYNTYITISGSLFNPNMIGGLLTVATASNPNPNTLSLSLALGTTGEYKTIIQDVINSTKAIVQDPYKIQYYSREGTITQQVKSFDYSNYNISFSFSNADIQYITSSVVPKISVDVQLANFVPITGDVYRIKTFARKRNVDMTYRLIDDRIVQPQEILIDPFYSNQTTFHDTTNNKRLVGFFTNQLDVQKYWLTGSNGSGSIPSSSSYAPDVLAHGVQIFPWQSDTVTPLSASFDYHTWLATSSSYTYLENSDLALTFRAMAQYDPVSQTWPELEIYMSGSAFLPSHPPRALPNNYVGYGKFVGSIILSESMHYYPQVKFPFCVDRDGYGQLVFKIKGGTWTLARISLKPNEELGFTPNNVRYQIETDFDVSSSIDFKIEYFDYTGQQAQYITFINNLLLRTAYVGRQYLTETFQKTTGSILFDAPNSRVSGSTALLHEYDLNRNVATINGILTGIKKSDIYTREAYIALISTRSSSRQDDVNETVFPPLD